MTIEKTINLAIVLRRILGLLFGITTIKGDRCPIKRRTDVNCFTSHTHLMLRRRCGLRSEELTPRPPLWAARRAAGILMRKTFTDQDLPDVPAAAGLRHLPVTFCHLAGFAPRTWGSSMGEELRYRAMVVLVGLRRGGQHRASVAGFCQLAAVTV
jgi:hypothetical protein